METSKVALEMTLQGLFQHHTFHQLASCTVKQRRQNESSWHYVIFTLIQAHSSFTPALCRTGVTETQRINYPSQSRKLCRHTGSYQAVWCVRLFILVSAIPLVVMARVRASVRPERKKTKTTQVNTDSTLTALNKPDSAKEPSTLVADLCLTVHLNERQVSCATFYTKKELNNSQSCSKSHVAVLWIIHSFLQILIKREDV